MIIYTVHNFFFRGGAYSRGGLIFSRSSGGGGLFEVGAYSRGGLNRGNTVYVTKNGLKGANMIVTKAKKLVQN